MVNIAIGHGSKRLRQQSKSSASVVRTLGANCWFHRFEYESPHKPTHQRHCAFGEFSINFSLLLEHTEHTAFGPSVLISLVRVLHCFRIWIFSSTNGDTTFSVSVSLPLLFKFLHHLIGSHCDIHSLPRRDMEATRQRYVEVNRTEFIACARKRTKLNQYDCRMPAFAAFFFHVVAELRTWNGCFVIDDKLYVDLNLIFQMKEIEWIFAAVFLANK